MTWTDAALEALQQGLNAYRDEAGRVRMLDVPFTSRTGDWMVDGQQLVSTDPPCQRFELIVAIA
jgi:hypothetical protein